MELLDRYLAAVRANLPAARADDITAELRGDLLERVEAREAALGRPLDQTECGALLKAFGRPIVVASRYRDHQQLIGPEVYPFYVHALRIVLVVGLAVLLYTAIVPALIGHEDFARALTRGISKAWDALFTAFAIVTLVFAVMERTGAPRAWIDDWRPEQLPAATTHRKNSWALPFEIGAGLWLLLWLMGLIPIPAGYTGNGLHIEPGGVWALFYWPIVGVVVARLGLTLVDWLHPTRQLWRPLVGVALALGELALVSLLLTHGPWAIVNATGADAAQVAKAGIGINVAIRTALVVALFVSGFRLVAGLYRFVMRLL
jgi:hypothetical protein